MKVAESIKVRLANGWVDNTYSALTTCYHAEEYGVNVDRQKKINKITEVIRKGHVSIMRYINLYIHLELIPHDTAMQLRTHKFLDCQVTSQRYTGTHLLEGDEMDAVNKFFYLREPGIWRGRNGTYEITERNYWDMKEAQMRGVLSYRTLIEDGIDEEVARHVLPQGIRQSMAINTNLQALMDVIKVRTRQDSQYEIREIMDGIIDELPEELNPIMQPFLKKFYGKNMDTF